MQRAPRLQSRTMAALRTAGLPDSVELPFAQMLHNEFAGKEQEKSTELLERAGFTPRLASAIVEAARIAIAAHHRIMAEHPEYVLPWLEFQYKRELREAIWGTETPDFQVLE